MSALLTVSGLSLAFGGLRALDDFSMVVEPGEFHGIIGPNGAGKTTAINVLTGFLWRNAGHIQFDGKPLPPAPHRIAAAGIGRTFQSPTIFSALSAVENVMTGGHRWTGSGLFDAILKTARAGREEARLRAEATGWLERVGFAFAPESPVSALPFGELRKLEIARALMARPRLLFLDEPTAGLTADEVTGIGQLLREVSREAGSGMAVVLVEHNVPFVFSLCDRVTAVDKGRVIASGPPEVVRASPAVIESYLGGGSSAPAERGAVVTSPAKAEKEAVPLLEVRGLQAGYGRMTVVSEINLSVAAGELVVLCGRNGAGKSTILNAIAGQPKISAGTVTLGNRRIDHLPVSGIVSAGVGLVPQERGIIAGQSIEANLELAAIGLGKAAAAERREEILDRFPKLRERRKQLAGTLSGGERQMLALAKVLIRRPALMLLDEPTIGLAPTIVDELQAIVARISADGIALIVAEQNVGWVSPLANRAYLLERGRIIASGAPETLIRQDQIVESYLGQQPAGISVTPFAAGA